MIPVKPGPRETIATAGTRETRISDYSGTLQLDIGKGRDGFHDEASCKEKARDAIDTEKNYFDSDLYEYGIDVKSFPVKKTAYAAHKRRQKTTLGSETGWKDRDKGLPVFDDDGNPEFHGWRFVKDESGDPYGSIAAATSLVTRDLEAEKKNPRDPESHAASWSSTRSSRSTSRARHSFARRTAERPGISRHTTSTWISSPESTGWHCRRWTRWSFHRPRSAST
jgi:hypothetical protein